MARYNPMDNGGKIKAFCSGLLLLSLYSLTVLGNDYLDQVRKEYESLLNKKYVLLPHKGTYLLPFSYNLTPNNRVYDELAAGTDYEKRGKFNRNPEAEFQISFLILTSRRFLGTKYSVFLGYTHQSWWQVYNASWSRPFRETNYAPELFARNVLDTPKDLLFGKLVAYDFGFIHQSNGQVQELSRSWNRLFLRTIFLVDSYFLKLTLWYRPPARRGMDDNPDIHDYKGLGEIEIDRVWARNRLQLRIIPGTKKQGVELSYSYPLKDGMRFFAKIGYGYGLNLIDYNSETKRLGVGFILADFFTSID